MAGPLEDDYSDGRNEHYPTEATRVRKGKHGCNLPHEGAADEPLLHKMLSGSVELKVPPKKKRKSKG